MILDPLTIAVFTAVVVLVSGGLFITETLLRRDDSAGTMWALGFLAAILTTLLYLVWAWDPSTWWAIAAGNAFFVAGTGFMWLGNRRYNGRSVAIPAILVGAGSGATALAVAIEGDRGGDWAGALWMFGGIVAFATASAIECWRGDLRRTGTALTLGVVFGVEATYYAARSLVFVVAGPTSDLFSVWFGGAATGILTILLIVTAVVCTSVLRAGRAQVRGLDAPSPAGGDGVYGILSADVFRRSLEVLCRRARPRKELVGVIAVHLDDLDHITTAFGRETLTAVLRACREAVRSSAPSAAIVGDGGPAALVIAVASDTPWDARRQAMSVYRGVFDALTSTTAGVLPVVGIGVALTDVAGYDPDELLRVARSAASRAMSSMASAVIVADSR